MSKTGARWRLDSAADLAGKPEHIRRQLSPFLNEPTRDTPAVHPAPRPQPERTAAHAPDAPAQVEALYSGRVLVRVESRRCGVQCDPDNIVVKWHIDALRFAGVLRDDTSAAIDLQVTEVRVPTKKEEGVLITLIPL